jgi:hypothetical protein
LTQSVTDSTNSLDGAESWEVNSTFSFSRDFPPFIESEGSLLCSQEPTTGPFPERNESNPHPPTLFP